MTDPLCAAPIATTSLVSYWLDELDAADEERVESHLFACDGCSSRLEEMASLARAIQEWARRGQLRGSATRALLRRLENDTLHIRRYRLEPGDRIFCTVGAEDDFVTLELAADFSGVDRVDLIMHYVTQGGTETRMEDVPVDDGRVIWAEPGEPLRQLAAIVIDVRLVAVDFDGERVLASYQLNHVPFRPDAP
jgi:hypothetical protein